MSSKKHSSSEYHLKGKNDNRQNQTVLRHDTISGASSYATVEDEKYYKYISEQITEVENRGDEKIKKLKKSIEEYISEQMREVENRVNENVKTLKNSMENYISEQIEKTEKGRHEEKGKLEKSMKKYFLEQMEKIENATHEEIKKLKKCMEELMKETPQHGKDRNSQVSRSEAKQLGHELVDKPLLNQSKTMMENQAPADQCCDGSTKTTYGSDNVKMGSEYNPANKGHLAMGAAEKPLAHPPTGQLALQKGMGREIWAKEYFDKSVKRPADSPKDSTIPGLAPTIHRQRYMEDTKQSASYSSHRQVAVRIGSEIGAEGCHDYTLKTQADSPRDSAVSGHSPLNSNHLSVEVVEQNTLEADSPRRLCVLLLGSSGNGKSSIGNSILGKDVFRTSFSVKSSTPCIAMDSAQVGYQTVQVVDGPSILDPRDADQDFMEQIVIDMEKSLTLCDYVFSAIVIVLRFGVRFTKQEVNTIKLIKSVLGDNVIKDYGICAVTCGDNFEHAVEEAREDGELLTFEGWCREQTGEVKALFEECSFRCVLFNNRTKDENTKNAQRLEFLKMVNPVKPYSKKEFLKAQTSLNEVIGTDKLIHDLEEHTQKIIDITRRDLDDLSDEDSVQHMDSLLQRLKNHQVILRELGFSSPKIRGLTISMQLLENEIGSKIRRRRLMEDNRSLITSLSPSISSLASHQPTPSSSTYGYCGQSLFSHQYPSGQETESGNMSYTSSLKDWHIVQNDSNPLPTGRGHSGVSFTGLAKYIWEYLRRSARKLYPL